MSRRNFTDMLAAIAPPWLADRPGLRTGYALLFTAALAVDMAIDAAVQALYARFPGLGTPTALPMLARDRGVIRSPADTDATFAVRLRSWMADRYYMGTMRGLARQVQAFLPDHPRVRVINRAGVTFTREADGSEATATMVWNWDGVSHPSRAGRWSDLWIVVYSTAYPLAGTWGDGALWGGTDGFGHDVPSVDAAALRSIVQDWKAAHSHVVAMIWTQVDSDFNPAGGGRMPDGTWGEWGYGDPYLPTRPSDLRFWEFP